MKPRKSKAHGQVKNQNLSAHMGVGRREQSAKSSQINKSKLHQQQQQQYTCFACKKRIVEDRYLLKACDKFWHENCLTCDKCNGKLAELGSSLFCKSNMLLCRQDYLELFGQTGICSVCEKLISSSEMAMRAKQNVYHLECFACQLCNERFCVGDRFYLCENKVVCQYDYEEHILPIQRSLIMEQQQQLNDTRRPPSMVPQSDEQLDSKRPSETNGREYQEIIGSLAAEGGGGGNQEFSEEENEAPHSLDGNAKRNLVAMFGESKNSNEAGPENSINTFDELETAALNDGEGDDKIEPNNDEPGSYVASENGCNQDGVADDNKGAKFKDVEPGERKETVNRLLVS